MSDCMHIPRLHSSSACLVWCSLHISSGPGDHNFCHHACNHSLLPGVQEGLRLRQDSGRTIQTLSVFVVSPSPHLYSFYAKIHSARPQQDVLEISELSAICRTSDHTALLQCCSAALALSWTACLAASLPACFDLLFALCIVVFKGRVLSIQDLFLLPVLAMS